MSAPVFISHSSRDKSVAETLCQALEKRGIQCWISSRDIGPGQNFQEAIVDAVTGARVMVLVFSSHANNSDEIKKELALASQNRLAVIPTRVEDVMPTAAFKYELATRQWIDIFNDWEQAIGLLAGQIREIIDQERPVPVPGAPASVTRPIGPRPNRMPLIAAGIVGLLIVAAAGVWFVTSRPIPTAVVIPTITGKWVSGEMTNAYDRNDKFTLRLEFDQSGDTLLGTVTEIVTDRGSDKKGIRDGHVAGDSVTFNTALETTDGSYKETYRGTIKNDVIDFIRQDDTPSGGELEKFSAKRQ